MEIKDVSGTPRPDCDIEAALQAVKERIIRGPTEVFVLHLITIKDALEELLSVRRAAKPSSPPTVLDVVIPTRMYSDMPPGNVDLH